MANLLALNCRMASWMLSGKNSCARVCRRCRRSCRAFEAGPEHRVDRQVGVGVRRDRADLDARGAFVADRDADHRAAVDRRDLDLVRRLEVRVEAAIGVDARVEDETEVVAVGQDPLDEIPGEGRDPILALRVVEDVLALLAIDMLVCSRCR